MGDFSNLAQKVKGKYQKAKGELHQESGDPLKGTLEKVKGGINEGIADSKLKSRRSHSRNNII